MANKKCSYFKQAYESLHSKLEITSARKAIAQERVLELETEKRNILSYALSEGFLLPSFLGNDN